MDGLNKVLLFARMVKIEHSVFALPFAYMGAFIAAAGWPGWPVFLLLTLAMVAIRSFAMAYNRLADLPFDRENPRTRNRPLVTGEISVKETRVFVLCCAAVFIAACAGLNKACFALSVPALLYAAFYSYVKRFSWTCHFVLGSVLGLAPLAGWIAVHPGLPLPALLLFFGVLFWVAGFDILYACQDVEFDRSWNLRSIPVRFGIGPALLISSFCHVNAAIFFLLSGLAAWLQWPFFLVWALVSSILIFEHTLIDENDLSRINLAFFTLNGLISIVLFCGALLAL